MKLSNTKKMIDKNLKKEIKKTIKSISGSNEDSLQLFITKATNPVCDIVKNHLTLAIKKDAPSLVHKVIAAGSEIIAKQLTIEYCKEIYQKPTIEQKTPQLENNLQIKKQTHSKYSFKVKILEGNLYSISGITQVNEGKPNITEKNDSVVKTFVYNTNNEAQQEKENWKEYIDLLGTDQEITCPIKYGIKITTDINDHKSLSQVFPAPHSAENSYDVNDDGDIIEKEYYNSYSQAKEIIKELKTIETQSPKTIEKTKESISPLTQI